ncbi:hypothetical protein SAMN05421642_11750 [Rhodococcoides kyotonense]|uniref:Uncharacterized protein n=1 Tax=Rhodococcoides kyotonense TaxID=398843 RepID=A0A239MCL8_9NOCA|nr:hypothetical protein SAMN05421642_11750 [Rhodococcus kyotonensis]
MVAESTAPASMSTTLDTGSRRIRTYAGTLRDSVCISADWASSYTSEWRRIPSRTSSGSPGIGSRYAEIRVLDVHRHVYRLATMNPEADDGWFPESIAETYDDAGGANTPECLYLFRKI